MARRAGPTLPVVLDSGLAAARRPKPDAVLRGPAAGEAGGDGAARFPRPSAAPGHHPWLVPKAFGQAVFSEPEMNLKPRQMLGEQTLDQFRE